MTTPSELAKSGFQMVVVLGESDTPADTVDYTTLVEDERADVFGQLIMPSAKARTLRGLQCTGWPRKMTRVLDEDCATSIIKDVETDRPARKSFVEPDMHGYYAKLIE